MIAILIFVIHWYLAALYHIVFLHRYSAHGHFTMGSNTEKVFYFLGWLILGPSFMSPRAYAVMHNAHHHHADTEIDPHSPHFTKNFFKLVYKQAIVFDKIFKNDHVFNNDPRYKSKLINNWDFFDKLTASTFIRTPFLLFYIYIYYFLDISLIFYPLLIVHSTMGLFQGSIHAWVTHKIGTRNFETNDFSRNTVKKDYYYLGELLHNNHHKYSKRINFAIKTNEFDPGFHFLKALRAFKVIKFNDDEPVEI